MSRQLPQTPPHCPTASYLTNQLIIEECVYLLDMGSWSIYKYIISLNCWRCCLQELEEDIDGGNGTRSETDHRGLHAW
ncbi:uncharacterized protein YALI1_D23721g [Yarrowia lipolytica]|uniref:Uncharacterized protein n=1 Tax=Yarrowia lipolytica TaxID=4952 RepID=A0A1D8NF75_YARLL|nr:hypothetical protein YALI1_D23721g [Yarrowia lipolytica]